MSKSSRSVTTKRTKRERQLTEAFGVHKDEVSKTLARYMRKNPRQVVAKLRQIYGTERLIKYLAK